MEIKSSLKNHRLAPRKVRLIADLVRGKGVDLAKQELTFCKKRAAVPVLRLLNSALANAKNIGIKDEDFQNLYIKKIIVEESRKLKRWRPIARGSAHPIQKKTSNIIMILDKREGEKDKNNKKNTKNPNNKK